MDLAQLEHVLDMPRKDQLKHLGLDEETSSDVLLHQFEAYVTKFASTLLGIDPTLRHKLPTAMDNVRRRLHDLKAEPTRVDGHDAE